MKKATKIIISSALIFVIFLTVFGLAGLAARKASTNKPRADFSNGTTGSVAVGLGANPAAPGIIKGGAPIISPAPVTPTIDTTTAIRAIAIADYLTLQVNALETSTKTVTEITKSYNGYVATYNVDNQGAYPSGTFTLMVPTAKIDAFVAELKAIGTYETGGRTAQDLTAQVIDIAAQLNTLYAEEKEYVSFFSKAKTVKDMLDIQQSLQQVRAQIQSLEGQQKYYASITTFASVQLTLTQKAASTDVNKPIGFALAFKNSLENIKVGYALFLTWLGGNIIAVLVWLIILVLIILAMKKYLIKK